MKWSVETGMGMDRRPKKPDGSLYHSCDECKIEPGRCKGFCIFQKLEENPDTIFCGIDLSTESDKTVITGVVP